jgi:hypothetical protein
MGTRIPLLGSRNALLQALREVEDSLVGLQKGGEQRGSQRELLVPKESEKARFDLVPLRRSVRFPGGAGKNPMGDPHRPYLS